MWKLHHLIYENDNEKPVLEHVFFGETPEECVSILNAHSKYDLFLRSALLGLPFNGMQLKQQTFIEYVRPS